MSQATENERCMFFVGGDDYKSNSPSGQSQAGGCTKAWWDSQPNIDTVAGKQTAMEKLMGPDGESLVSVSTTVHSLYDIGGTNYVKVTDVTGTAFNDVEVGMLAYHPDSAAMLVGGSPGVFKVREVGIGGPGESYIVLDTTWLYEGYPTGLDGDTVVVGGAWNSLDTFIENYVDPADYSHEVWVNKDLAPSTQWDWSDWSGDVYNNTWLKVIGFHRVPGDITDPGGIYYQTTKSMHDDGVHADKLVEIDMSSLSGDLIEENNSENIALRGFYFTNASTSNAVFVGATASWENINFSHVAIDLSYRLELLQCKNFLLSDSLLANSPVYTDVVFNTDAISIVFFINNYVRHGGSGAGLNVASGAVYVGFGNVVDIEGSTAGLISTTGSVSLSMNNTYLNYDNSLSNGAFRANYSGAVYSINDIIFNKYADVRALEVAKFGGSHITKNLCAYSDEGQLDEVIYLHPDEATGNIRKHDIDNLLEVDPLLDSGYQSRNKKVLLGGREVGGQKTAIGAVSQEHQFVGRSAKSNPGRLGIIR